MSPLTNTVPVSSVRVVTFTSGWILDKPNIFFVHLSSRVDSLGGNLVKSCCIFCANGNMPAETTTTVSVCFCHNAMTLALIATDGVKKNST